MSVDSGGAHCCKCAVNNSTAAKTQSKVSNSTGQHWTHVHGALNIYFLAKVLKTISASRHKQTSFNHSFDQRSGTSRGVFQRAQKHDPNLGFGPENNLVSVLFFFLIIFWRCASTHGAPSRTPCCLRSYAVVYKPGLRLAHKHSQ